MTVFKYGLFSVITQKYFVIWPYMFWMIFGSALIESWGDIEWSWEQLKAKYFSIGFPNFVFWHFGIFLIYAAPFNYRAVVDGVIGLLWGVIYCYIYNSVEEK